MPNRLENAKSPYLKQHAHNPVDWHPWDEEALTLARENDRPIFLSIGYAACHWCHVMERESFESEDIARLLRENFVAIKVDREERPDLDEVYMTSVQLMTGHGGWPMSVFLTPDGRPFYGGTYYPQSNFAAIVSQLGEAWRNRRDDIEQVANELTEEIRKASQQRPLPGDGLPTPQNLLAHAVEDLKGRFDSQYGGFGNAPKFPPHHALRLLCQAVAENSEANTARTLLSMTLEKMACGGIYDHIGGGFHRYSTDRIWLVPHFEKMLYDQALLVRPYAEAGNLLDHEGFRRVARETCEWVLRDLRHPDGGFFSALDADSEGEEGKFYVWERAEAEALVGAEFCDRWQIRVEGNWHDEATRKPLSTNIPHLAEPLPDSFDETIQAARETLRATRDARPWPLRDEKILTAWNGLMLGALAYAGKALNEPRYIDAAINAATFCLTTLRPNGRLLHRWAEDDADIDAFLDDFAYLSDGLLDLYEATGDDRWEREAHALTSELLARFWDPEEAGFFFTSESHETLLTRTKELFDGALPSPNGVATRVLARLELPHAQALLSNYAALLTRAPQGTATLIGATLIDSSLVPQEGNDATITLYSPNEVVLKPGEAGEVRFVLSLPSGWHVNGPHPAEEYLIATKAVVSTDAPAAVGPAQLPGGEIYEGKITIPIPMQVAPEARSGEYHVNLTLTIQPCTMSHCLAPTDVTSRVMIRIQER